MFCSKKCSDVFHSANGHSRKRGRMGKPLEVPPEVWLCGWCNDPLPPAPSSVTRRRKYCRDKDCRQQAFLAGKPADYRSQVARRFRRGVTEDEYRALIAVQDGLCAICGVNPAERLDHDHRCCPGDKNCVDCIRGVLCNGCNWSLGWFRDDIVLLAGAVKYLRKPHLPGPAPHRVRRTRHRSVGGREAAEIREWGVAVGLLTEGQLGRIPNEVREAYANRGQTQAQPSPNRRGRALVVHTPVDVSPQGLMKYRRELIEQQGGECAIDGCEEPAFALDHDHRCCSVKRARDGCGRCIRGVLCRHCNSGLGFFMDDAEVIESAVRYLEDRGTVRGLGVLLQPNRLALFPLPAG
ncbi:endonuclease domain-containing protein [Geodermatophilus sp. CPCC 206100]|uniref:endonuclease domain-containing protein n=1 Tax=Geodermatophilus sp. CPCC 206100 TaxID=3020054 RepID=UPI003AFFF085